MTKFEGCYLTEAGLALSSKKGIDLVFTRAETGSGIFSSPDEVRNLTQLKRKEYDYQLEEIQIKDETADVIFYVTNRGVTSAYKLTEIGIYARDETETEILYCVVFAYEENAEEIDREVAGQITYCQKFCVQTKVSADANVSVQVDGTDHEWTVNYFKKYAGAVRIEKGTLQEQIDNHTHKTATTSENGFMSHTDKIKLDNVAEGANKTIVDSVLSSTSTNPIQNQAVNAAIENLSKAIEQANKLITNLQALRASPTTYGMTKVTDSSAVTDSTGLALAATEKNASIQGTLANQISQLNTDYSDGWKTNPNTYVPVTYGDGFEKINISDQVRCSRLNNGMRCITGALRTYKEISLLEDVVKAITVPDDFALIDCGIMYQKWISLIETSSGKAYNFLFSGNGFYAWGYTTIPANSTLSIYLLY